MESRIRQAAKRFYWKNEEIRGTIRTPIIIATKGNQAMGHKLMAFSIASSLQCPLIKEHDFDNYEEKSLENQSRLWKNICNLAKSQLSFGLTVVIDSELSYQNEFDRLKELSEITNIPLAVFECRVEHVDKFWYNHDMLIDSFFNASIATEFMEKPKALFSQQNIHSTKFNMDKVPKVLVDIVRFSLLDSSVSDSLIDLRAHIDPELECELTNSCNHVFKFINIEDEYKRRCCRCRQLASGFVYNCTQCRFFVHRTCSFLPKSLTLTYGTYNKMYLNLRCLVPGFDANASCFCCKQLLCNSTSNEYYSIDDEHRFFDLDCLFLLPDKYRTKLHEHELYRCINPNTESWCKECDAIIDQKSIFYYCYECKISMDVYCLWLPETVEFERHRHSFKLSVVPKVDSDPYYCDVCEKERDTERWIYYCKECDFPIHPRCLVDAPCLPRSSSTIVILATHKNSKEELDDTFHGCSSSHSSIEGTASLKSLPTKRTPEVLRSGRVRVPLPRTRSAYQIMMAKEFHSRNRPQAKELHLLFLESTKGIELPIIITTKGQSYTGRKLVALTLAAALDCMLIDKDNLCEAKIISSGSKQVCYKDISRISLSQLQIGLSVVIDCELSQESEFCILRDLATTTKTPLFIVECKPSDEYAVWRKTFPNLPLEEFQRTMAECSNYEYDVGDTLKLLVNITTPTFDDIKKCIPEILSSISAYTNVDTVERPILCCSIHSIGLGFDYPCLKDDICYRCSKQLLTAYIKCTNCRVVLHRTCTNLPLQVRISDMQFTLKEYRDENDKVRCNCCKELVKGCAYISLENNICFDLECFFSPPQPRINLHLHRLCLKLHPDDLTCEACGFLCTQKMSYTCFERNCSFEIGVNCGLLQGTVTFERHRHPFHLAVSPEHDSNQYYCDVCEKERDQKHWIYYCAGCDFPIHIHCLVPTAGCPSLELSSN